MMVPQRWRGALTAGLVGGGLLFLVGALAILSGAAAWGYDFAAYHAAAQRLAETGSPYQAETLGGPFRPGPFGLYLYSPLLAVLLLPTAALPLDSATLAWLVARLAVLSLACALMPVPWRIRAALFGIACISYPVLRDLVLGNVSLAVTLAAVVGWRFLDRPTGAAAIAVAVALRPTMALILAWWLVRGRWAPLAWALAAGAVLVLLSLPLVGLRGWLDYATLLRNLADFEAIPRNLALGQLVLAFGGPPWLATPALVGGYAIAIAAMLLSLRRDRELSYVVVLGATLLLSPLLWDHYLTHLLVPAAFLAVRGRWWGLALPLAGWLPEMLFALVALAGLVLPFLAPHRGQPAGTLLERLPTRRAVAPA